MEVNALGVVLAYQVLYFYAWVPGHFLLLFYRLYPRVYVYQYVFVRISNTLYILDVSVGS